MGEMYDINEVVALVINTFMGLMAYIGIQINITKVRIRPATIFWGFFISLFLSHVVTGLLSHTEYYKMRSSIIPIVSCFSTYIMKLVVNLFQNGSLEKLTIFLLETLIGRMKKGDDYGNDYGNDYENYENYENEEHENKQEDDNN